MVDIKKLNRIKGILSARQGAEIPKFQQGAKFAMYNGRQTIYSSDQSSWFNDESLTSAYTGSLGGFKSIQYNPQTPKNPIQPASHLTSSTPVVTAIPGNSSITPTTAVENAAREIEKVKEVKLFTEAQEIANKNLGVQLNTENKPLIDSSSNVSKNKNRLKTQENNALTELKTNLVTPLSRVTTLGSAISANQTASNSQLTNAIDSAYSLASAGISNLGPAGQIVSAGMDALATVGNLGKALVGGSDQMTKIDKWMDSSLLSWNIGLINNAFGKNSNSFSVDSDIVSSVGSSYGGTVNDLNDAAAKAGKKYGLFSQKDRKKANATIANAVSKQNLMGNISTSAEDQRLAVQSMGEQAGLAYSLMTDGGYNQKYTYAAKQGGILEWNPVIELDWEPQVELNWELPTFKEGGNIDINKELEWIPEFKSGNKIRTIEELIEYAKKQNPRFIQRLSEEPRGIKFTDDEGKEAEGSHYLESMGEYVIPRIQEVDGELQFFNHRDALNKAIETGNYLKLDPEEAIIFAEQYKQGWPDFFKKFKEGGSVGNSDVPEIEETIQKNVIPEGALHKNKHHMEHAEGLTKKGIPVIDDDGEQQAEIEHSEIIFTLEVTKKLEEYYKIFYSDESSNKEKEQAALEAGKLLVYQILENTEDRTGLIESCKKGGSLTLKKSTDDLIEEVLEWMPTVIIVEEDVEEKPKKKEEKSDKELMKEAIKEVLIDLLTK